MLCKDCGSTVNKPDGICHSCGSNLALQTKPAVSRLQLWYNNLTKGQLKLVYTVSSIMILVYLIGLIPLTLLLYLHFGKHKI